MGRAESGTGRRRLLQALSLPLAVVALASAPAGAAPVAEPSNLAWSSPRDLQPAVPADFASVDPCPATRPDGSAIAGARIVRLSLTLPKGAGRFSQDIPVAEDGSWTATWALDLTALVFPKGRITVDAECWDVAWRQSATLGQYKEHGIRAG